MGSPSTENGRGGDEDSFEVTLVNDYHIMTTEVTQGMFTDLMGYAAFDGLSTADGMGSFGVGVDYPALSLELAYGG